jgi:hypothetical protein
VGCGKAELPSSIVCTAQSTLNISQASSKLISPPRRIQDCCNHPRCSFFDVLFDITVLKRGILSTYYGYFLLVLDSDLDLELTVTAPVLLFSLLFFSLRFGMPKANRVSYHKSVPHLMTRKTGLPTPHRNRTATSKQLTLLTLLCPVSTPPASTISSTAPTLPVLTSTCTSSCPCQ